MTREATERAAALDAELRERGTPARAAQERAYLKSSLAFYGVGLPDVRAVAKRFRATSPGLDHDALVDLVTALWDQPTSGPVHERRGLAVELLGLHLDALGPDDVPLLERFLRESRTWALVDAIAPNLVGPLVERFPDLSGVLDRWATDDDLWLRRSALLALLLPLRRGEGDWDRFARYADQMLEEKEFFIRKAIGWVLREVGKKRADLVFSWILPRAGRASGVTLREAVKPLSEAQRVEVLAAR